MSATTSTPAAPNPSRAPLAGPAAEREALRQAQRGIYHLGHEMAGAWRTGDRMILQAWGQRLGHLLETLVLLTKAPQCRDCLADPRLGAAASTATAPSPAPPPRAEPLAGPAAEREARRGLHALVHAMQVDWRTGDRRLREWGWRLGQVLDTLVILTNACPFCEGDSHPGAACGGLTPQAPEKDLAALEERLRARLAQLSPALQELLRAGRARLSPAQREDKAAVEDAAVDVFREQLRAAGLLGAREGARS